MTASGALPPFVAEYGSTAERKTSGRLDRSNVMLMLCSASLVLFLVGTVLNHSEVEPRRDSLLSSETKSKMHAIAASVAKKAVAHPAAKLAPAHSEKLDEGKKATAAAETPAQAKTHPAAKAAQVKAVQVAHGKMLQEDDAGEEAAPAEDAPAEEPAEEKPAEEGAAEGGDSTEEGGGSKEADGEKKADGGEEGKGSVQEDEFKSPMGNLHPTGIMSVFFNEKIMVTAVCVIATLLIAICCFANYFDCGLG